jgi:hypothetical protein
MKVNLKAVFFHTFGWIVFLLLPLLLLPVPFNHAGLIANNFLLNYLLSGFFLVLYFYFNFNLAIPYLLLRRKTILFLLANVGAAGLILLLHQITGLSRMEVVAQSAGGGGYQGYIIPFGVTYFRIFVLLTVSIGIKLYNRWKETENEKANAELAFLKAQINPHFLFNTLNGIYALTVKKSDAAPDAVSRLSAIMRYVITEAHHDTVSLELEIGQIRNLIELQKLRLTSSTTVTLEVSGNTTGLTIVPLILMTFIENAFKHGISTEEDSPILIQLRVDEERKLRFHVRNKKPKHRSGNHDSGGIGLENTKRRLEQEYGGRHDLILRNGANDFLVDLVIQFD